MLSLGMDIGSAAIKLSLVDENARIVSHHYQAHKGDIRNVLLEALGGLAGSGSGTNVAWGAVCGSGARLLAKIQELRVVNDIQAAVDGALSLERNPGSIIEIGGQSAKYITGFSSGRQSRIQISINSSCAAGTGSFLEEHISRLGLELEDYAAYAARHRSIPRIAGRCSVFAKTDITHHQQQGVPVEDVLMGLAYAVVRNFRGSVMKKLPRQKPILFAGGVSRNQAVVTALRDVLRLEGDELMVLDCSANLSSLGAALAGLQSRSTLSLEAVIEHLNQTPEVDLPDQSEAALANLASFGRMEIQDRHWIDPLLKARPDKAYYLGVDVGSTSVNLALTDARDRVVAYRYLRTKGQPAAQVLRGLAEIKDELGFETNIAGAGVTGSGRYMIAELLGADIVKDEITAQAKAAVTLDPEIDTIFEIGGQDSKFISLDQGVVVDFQMNKVCAAGTGSFLEEQAKKFAIPVEELGKVALFGSRPVNLGERCTVFMETNVAAHLAQGARVEDIAAGLCYSIAKNYLNRVVGTKRIGGKISFQGGLAFNQGVINAFKSLTGKEVMVPPFFSVSGAMGAAILAREEAGRAPSSFKGFAPRPPERNQAKSPAPAAKKNYMDLFNQQVNDLIFEGYSPDLVSGRKTVGIPRALFTFGMFSMFNAFFRALGFNVLLSESSNENTIRLGQEYSLDETCYPVKLINGHVAELVQKKVDYIFFPDLFTVDHPGSHTRQNFGCAYMQLAFKIVNQAMELKKHGIELLAPTFAFSLGPEFMMKSFGALGGQLGKTPEETGQAMAAGMQAYHSFEQRLQEKGRQAVTGLGPDEKAFVLISKIYGVADPVLNMGIPGKLMEMGYKVLGFYELPETDLAAGHPNMYWPFGQHILESAQLVKNHPNLYAIFLTHHCCGPDSVMSHFFREIMAGKPYLNIEVDEHSADVGVITRVEAFANSLSKVTPVPAEPIAKYVDQAGRPKANLKTGIAELGNGTTLYLPHLYPFSQIFKVILQGRGVKAEILPLTSEASIDLGRKHTLTSEYLSFTALLGDALGQLKQNGGAAPGGLAFMIPQNEGAEADGQYSRLVRTILDEQGRRDVDIVTPYLEDALRQPPEAAGLICRALVAGDLINLAPYQNRPEELERVLALAQGDGLDPAALESLARRVKDQIMAHTWGKSILVLGETAIIFNERLNHFHLKRLEEQGHRLIRGPLSEAMWLFWADYQRQNTGKTGRNYQDNLNALAQQLRSASLCLGRYSPFEQDPQGLIQASDQSVGYYAGDNGRYRQAKLICGPDGLDGVITVSSTYENTGIALGVLHGAFGNGRPLLNLTFDGNEDENESAKIDSFIHYL